MQALRSTLAHPGLCMQARMSTPTHPGLCMQALKSTTAYPGLCMQALKSTTAHPGLCMQALRSTPAHAGLCMQALMDTPAHAGLCMQALMDTLTLLPPTPGSSGPPEPAVADLLNLTSDSDSDFDSEGSMSKQDVWGVLVRERHGHTAAAGSTVELPLDPRMDVMSWLDLQAERAGMPLVVSTPQGPTTPAGTLSAADSPSETGGGKGSAGRGASGGQQQQQGHSRVDSACGSVIATHEFSLDEIWDPTAVPLHMVPAAVPSHMVPAVVPPYMVSGAVPPPAVPAAVPTFWPAPMLVPTSTSSAPPGGPLARAPMRSGSSGSSSKPVPQHGSGLGASAPPPPPQNLDGLIQAQLAGLDLTPASLRPPLSSRPQGPAPAFQQRQHVPQANGHTHTSSM